MEEIKSGSLPKINSPHKRRKQKMNKAQKDNKYLIKILNSKKISKSI